MNDKAKIYSYTIVYSAAEAFKDKTPYVVAIVEERKGKVTTLVEGYTTGRKVQIGDEVEFAGSNASGHPIYKFI